MVVMEMGMDPGYLQISCRYGGREGDMSGLSGGALHSLDVGVHCPREEAVAAETRLDA